MATAMALESETPVEPVLNEPTECYEVVDGLIVEEPPLGVYEGRLVSRLVRSIVLFDPPAKLGEMVEEVLFILQRSPRLRRRPDLAFVTQERWPSNRPTTRDAAWDVIPDLAVEITSPTDHIDDLMDKIDEYFEAGVRLVWVVYPKQSKVYAYESSTGVTILGVGDELSGGVVLPGYRFPVVELFLNANEESGPTPVA